MTLRHKTMAAGAVGAGLALVMGATAHADVTGTPSVQATSSATASTSTGGGRLVVKDTEILGPVDQNQHVAARDNGQSVSYGGKSYWFFDDTMEKNPTDTRMASEAAMTGFRSSTAGVTSDLDASDNITLHSSAVSAEADTGAPTDFVPLSDEEKAFQDAHDSSKCSAAGDSLCGGKLGFWPGATVADPTHHRILVFYGKLCRGGPAEGACATGTMGQSVGSGIAAVDMNTKKTTRLTVQNQTSGLNSPEGADPTLLFGKDDAWGTGGAVVSDGQLYAYGNCKSGSCGVARVPLDQVQDRSAWRFYAGNGQWSTDQSKAATTDLAPGGAGESVHYDATTKQYINTFMPVDSDQAQFQTSSTPWGPWSKPQDLFKATTTGKPNYAAFAHPEYTSKDGLTRYYTYYSSKTGQQMLVKVDFSLAG